MSKALTARQKEIYDNLMAQVAAKELFFFVDQRSSMQTDLRIFTYRLGGYSDWLQPDAIECRGIMFEMVDGEPVSLVCRPMEKFFNYAEVKAWQALGKAPASIGETVQDVMIKEDGSLISTFLDGGMLFVKSKASLFSDQASAANFLLLEDKKLRARLTALAEEGYTVNMEYVSPLNRIVIGYTEPHLVILNVRDNETGEYVPYEHLFADPIIRKNLVEREAIEIEDLNQFVEETYKKEGFEGYVIKTEKGFVKIKTEWYCALHRTKSSLGNNKDLFVNIATGTSDDLKQMFVEDLAALQKINAFEDAFIGHLNSLLALAESAIQELRGSSRKDFAIGLSKNLSPEYKLIFGPLMTWFSDNDKDKLASGIIDMMCKNFNNFIPDYYK